MATVDEFLAETLGAEIDKPKPRRDTPRSDFLDTVLDQEHRVVFLSTRNPMAEVVDRGGFQPVEGRSTEKGAFFEMEAEPLHFKGPLWFQDDPLDFQEPLSVKVQWQLAEPTAQEAQALAATLLQHLGLEEIHELTQVIEETLATARAAAQGPVEPALEGLELDSMTEAERIEAALGGLISRFGFRRQLVAQSLSTYQVAEHLDVSAEEVERRRELRSLVAIEDPGERWLFPAWQFDDDGPEGLVAGLPQILPLLTDLAPLQTAAWLTRRKMALDARSPLDALHDGDVERVALLARRVSAIRR